MKSLLPLILLSLVNIQKTRAYQSLVGVWRLKLQVSCVYKDLFDNDGTKQKDFTVFSSPQNRNTARFDVSEELYNNNDEEILLRLSEDGTFMQYNKFSDTKESRSHMVQQQQDANASANHNHYDNHYINFMQNLENQFDQIRAANHETPLNGKWNYDARDGTLVLAANRHDGTKHDTLFVGDVSNMSYSSGRIQRGKFTYPPTHPHFFDSILSLMFRPFVTGRYQLQQVLAEVIEDNMEVEKFVYSDLFGKRFLLTSMPMKRKKKQRYSRWRKTMIDENNDNDPFTANMQVMGVELYQNRTWSTVSGLGDSVTLRGKWDIFGQDKDQLWMQVSRFGFGRSVSGSTFSEGSQLTQNDDKSYWGVIEEVELTNNQKKLEMHGMILLGHGLEPTSIGRFIMSEQLQDVLDSHDSVNDDDGDDYNGDGDENDDDNIIMLGEFQ